MGAATDPDSYDAGRNMGESFAHNGGHRLTDLQISLYCATSAAGALDTGVVGTNRQLIPGDKIDKDDYEKGCNDGANAVLGR